MKDLVLDSFNTIVDVIIAMGPLGGILIVILESIIPILPLALFIAINISAFGMTWGFLISWIATIMGCIISFYVFRKGFGKRIDSLAKNREKVNDLIKWISKVKLTHLTILLALPFTPAFLVNIAGGLSKINVKKYLLALFIGKIFMVYFWGYIGYNLIEVFNNPKIIVEIVLMLLVAYIISKFVGDKLNID